MLRVSDTLERITMDRIENYLIGANTLIGLANIYDILGIIILSVQILLILVKAGRKIYQKILNKDFDEAVQEAEDTLDKLEEIKDNIKKDGEEDGN